MNPTDRRVKRIEEKVDEMRKLLDAQEAEGRVNQAESGGIALLSMGVGIFITNNPAYFFSASVCLVGGTVAFFLAKPLARLSKRSGERFVP